ncbi:MAG: hypothetical protein ACXWWA_07420 [Chitinophagaceae bacterium]
MKMGKIKILFLICATGGFLISCQKEVDFQDLPPTQPGGNGGGTNNTNIIGNWNFVGSNAKTYAALSFSESGQEIKSITVSDYNTENNAGTLTVSDNQFIFKDISHIVNDEANSKTYINGILFNEVTEPFNATYPPTDETRDYVRNSNDSITFTNMMANLPDPSGGGFTPVPTGPMGGKIGWLNDTLTVKINYSATQNITQGGIPANFEASVEGTMKFKRQ